MLGPTEVHLTDYEKETRLESITGYYFGNPALRTRAITRRAYVNDKKPKSMPEDEALATLGDSVINIIVLSQLIPDEDDEGKISKKRDDLVNHKKLTQIASDMGLKKCLKLGKCEGTTDKWDEGKALGESLESVIGAIYLDSLEKKEDGILDCKVVLRSIGLI